MKRAIILGLGAVCVAVAAIPTLVSAQFPPPPPATFYGEVPAGVVAGQTVIAIVVSGQSSAVCGDGIVVNAVSPGPVASGYVQRRLGSESPARNAMVSRMPIGRLGEPDEVAEVVHFLATSEGRLTHGHNLIVDGGYTLQ